MDALYLDHCKNFNRRCERAGWPMRCDPTLFFEAPELRTALAVWREIAAQRQWPQRCEMTPRLMKRFLNCVAILDISYQSERPRFLCRIAGTEIERLLLSATGSYLDEVVPQPFLERWQAILELAIIARQPVRTLGRLEFRNRTYLRVETLLVLLGPDDTRPESILVVVNASKSEQGAQPDYLTAMQTSQD